jgi:hypothetical protein
MAEVSKPDVVAILRGLQIQEHKHHALCVIFQEVVDRHTEELRARIAQLEKEAQFLRGSDARASMYLSIAADRLDAGSDYDGGHFDCDYEHPIHERITDICREIARLTAENQRLRADGERLQFVIEQLQGNDFAFEARHLSDGSWLFQALAIYPDDHPVLPWGCGADLRSAIDAARSVK